MTVLRQVSQTYGCGHLQASQNLQPGRPFPKSVKCDVDSIKVAKEHQNTSLVLRAIQRWKRAEFDSTGSGDTTPKFVMSGRFDGTRVVACSKPIVIRSNRNSCFNLPRLCPVEFQVSFPAIHDGFCSSRPAARHARFGSKREIPQGSGCNFVSILAVSNGPISPSEIQRRGDGIDKESRTPEDPKPRHRGPRTHLLRGPGI